MGRLRLFVRAIGFQAKRYWNRLFPTKAIAGWRFSDDAGHMNRSVLDTGGEVLVVSQFTLYGDARKGRRPGFSESAPPEEANRLYEYFASRVRAAGVSTRQGVFRATMDVALVNEGPVTILLDSRKSF